MITFVVFITGARGWIQVSGSGVSLPRGSGLESCSKHV